MLDAGDPTAVLTNIREGTHPISGETCNPQTLTEINALFHRAAAERGDLAHNAFQSQIRDFAIIWAKKGYPKNCSEYVKIVEQRIFNTLPQG